MKAGRELSARRRKVFAWLLLAVLAGGLGFFIAHKKEALKKEATRLLSVLLSRGTEVKLKIGKISGRGLGLVRFENVEVSGATPLDRTHTLLKIKEITLRYRLLDFFSKEFSSKLEIRVKEPEVTWSPRISLRKADFPLLVFLREWAMARKSDWKLSVEHAKIHGPNGLEFRVDTLVYGNNTFQVEVPFSHVNIHGTDISTVFSATGQFTPATKLHPDEITGRIYTEGTVINWKPAAHESEFHFDFSGETLRVYSSDFLGGFHVDGRLDISKDDSFELTIDARDYALVNLENFLQLGPSSLSPASRMDLDLRFFGDLWAPQVDARARFYNGWVTRRAFKAMEISVQGVWPTVNLTNSRILLDDGRSMRFADTSLEIADLFRGKTYEDLIGEASQDTFVWGDWQVSRPREEDREDSELLVQRELGDNASLKVRKLSESDPIMRDNTYDSYRRDLEVGLEYRLRKKDSLKVQFRDDEEFLGVERKVSF